MNKILHVILSMPKTILVNFCCLPLKQAIKLPILVDYKTVYKGLRKACFYIPPSLSFASIKIGWGYGSIGNPCNNKNYIVINGNGKIIFKGKAHFARGCTLRIDNNGDILFGEGFTANQNFTCFSNTLVSFGANCVAGWDVNIRDSDGHDIIRQSMVINPNRPISIGNHVWLASHCNILKGSIICDNSIIGFSTLVSGTFTESNIIVAGIPGKIIKRGINWEK